MTAVYDTIGVGYAALRVPDPRIARAVVAALGSARTVVSIGAGSGSYEPATTRAAVEPSRVMIGQRPAGSAPVVQAVAEALPFPDDAFDAALAVLTTHHWTDPDRGLAEMARVARRQVVLTWDADVTATSWLLAEYLPQITENERGLASLRRVVEAWPGAAVVPVPVPWDCSDGFLAAYWRRPQAYLSATARSAISAFRSLDPAEVEVAMRRLADELQDGTWQRRHGDLLGLEALDCGYRLVVNHS